MIISKKYNDELIGFIKIVREGLFNGVKDIDVQITNISFLAPVTDEFLVKYKLNKDFQFIATLNDWDDVDVSIYYKGGKLKPDCYYSRPDNWVEPHLLDIFQECIKQDTHTPNIRNLEIFNLKRSRKRKLQNIK